MSDLIKEAIAEAKIVREMAVKQAKAYLEEAFAPKVDAIISRRLQTEMEDDDEEELDIEEPVDEDVELGTDPDHEEAKENSELTENEDTSDIGTEDNKEPSKESSEETTEDPGGETDVKSDHDDAKESELTEQSEEDEEEKDIDLEQIVKELEDEADDIEYDLEDEDELKAEQELDAELEDDEKEEPVAEQDELDIDIEDDEKEEPVAEQDELDDKELEKLSQENVKLRKKLIEAFKAIKFQKNKLNEINILNAKLLFTNRVFSKFNLDDISKIKVIENFDRAKNVREVKLIFATLMENMKADKRKVSSKAQRLMEGASKAIHSTKSEKEQIVSEHPDFKDRVHKLAGIKNKK